jgi:hypothetical protein
MLGAVCFRHDTGAPCRVRRDGSQANVFGPILADASKSTSRLTAAFTAPFDLRPAVYIKPSCNGLLIQGHGLRQRA